LQVASKPCALQQKGLWGCGMNHKNKHKMNATQFKQYGFFDEQLSKVELLYQDILAYKALQDVLPSFDAPGYTVIIDSLKLQRASIIQKLIDLADE